jgi:hypothetical protein
MKVNDAYDELRLGIAMNPRIQDIILKATGAQTAIRLEIVQRLWSGYGEIVLVLEDLDAAGFPGRRTAADETRMRACLHWLAHFHATFIGEPPEGLWPTGTYWHLATRPDELEALTMPR